MLPFRGLTGLFGLLLTAILASEPAAAQQDQPTLRLLVLGSDTGVIQPAKSQGVDDAAVPALGSQAGRSMTAAFVGRPIDDALLDDIRDQLTAYYTALSRPFVDIAIPVQDVVDGTLRVNVIEAKRGQLTVEGNRWFDAQQYIDAIRTPLGAPIDMQTLATDTDWLNRNEGRHVAISVRPTDDPAVDSLTIDARDHLPLTVTLAADNDGTEASGLYRTGIGVDWSNAFWRGDDLNYNFVVDPDGFRLLQHTITYTTFLPWRDTMTLTAFIADTRGLASGPYALSVNGHYDILSGRYIAALPAGKDFAHHIEFGFDFKSTNSNVLSGGTSIFPGDSELDQFSLTYVAWRPDSLGSTGLTALLVGSPGHLSARNTASALQAQRIAASPTYAYGRVSIERLTSLPHDATWSARLTGQFSSDNLLFSEQLDFGGSQSIRGFMEQAATRDSGVRMEHELRFAPLYPNFLPKLSDDGSVVPFLFLDAGAGRDHLDLANQTRSWVEMLSVGPGLTWHYIPTAAFRLTWGFPLVRNGHIGAFLGPQFGTQITF